VRVGFSSPSTRHTSARTNQGSPSRVVVRTAWPQGLQGRRYRPLETLGGGMGGGRAHGVCSGFLWTPNAHLSAVGAEAAHRHAASSAVRPGRRRCGCIERHNVTALCGVGDGLSKNFV